MNDFRLETLVLGPLQTNTYIIYNNISKEAIVVDPAAEAEKIIKYLKEHDLVCSAIMLTHGHFDHILGVKDLKEATGADIYAHEEEINLLENPNLNASFQVGQAYTVSVDVPLKDGQILDLIGQKIKVLHTPGHTAGGVCYLFQDENVLLSGDTLFQASIGRSDFPTGNGRVLIDSIRTKLMVLYENIEVYPGHGNPTSIGYEKRYNQFIAT